MTNSKGAMGILLLHGNMALKLLAELDYRQPENPDVFPALTGSAENNRLFLVVVVVVVLNYGGKAVNTVAFINDGNMHRLAVKLVFTT